MIERVTLIDFGVHHETDIILNKTVNRFTGERGTGKTTASGRALAAGFTGANYLTTADGRGLNQQVRTGAESFTIRIKFIHGEKRYTLTRTMGANGGHDLVLKGSECEPGIDQTQAAIFALIGKRELVRAQLDNRPFLSRSKSDQDAEIMSVVPVRDITIDSRIVDLLVKYKLAEVGEPIIESMNDFDKLYELVKERRKDAKKALARINPGTPPENRPSKTEREYLADAQEFGKKLVALSEDRGRITGMIVHGEKAEEPRAEVVKPTEALAPAQEQANALRQELGVAQGIRSTLAAELRKLEVERKSVLSEKATEKKSCPTCGQSLTPKRREDTISRIENHQASIDLKLADAKDSEESLSRRVETANADVRRIQALWAKYEAACKVPAFEKVDLPALRAELEAVTKKAHGASENQKRAQGYAVAARQCAEYDKAQADLKAARVEVEDFEILCDRLGPKGIRVQIFQERSAPFMEKVNESAKTFGLSCTITEEFGLMVNGLPKEFVSEGDQLLFELAYRYALAIHSGLKVIVLDATSRLSQTERADVLWPHLDVLSASGVQIIVTETQDAPQAGTFWFTLVDGSSKVQSVAA